MKKRLCLFIQNIKLLKIKLLQTSISYHCLSSSHKKKGRGHKSTCLSTKNRPMLDCLFFHAQRLGFATANVKFVNEVGGTGILVDDE